MKKTVICKTCGAEIAKSADVCPNCGAKQNVGKKIIGLLIVFFGFFIIFGGIYAIYFNGLFNDGNTNAIFRDTDADIINSEATISLAEFNRIETGMTYTEVCEIIGGEGTLGSNVDIGNDEYKTEIYQWTGEGSIGSNANVTFQGGKVISKAQIGLK